MFSTIVTISLVIGGLAALASIVALIARRRRPLSVERATTQLRAIPEPESPAWPGTGPGAPDGPSLREISVAAWASRVIPLNAPVTTIGRALTSTIVLAEDPVSAEHCRIERAGTTFRLIDLGSTNKTWLNGRPVESVALRNGDQIRVGHTTFLFEGADERP